MEGEKKKRKFESEEEEEEEEMKMFYALLRSAREVRDLISNDSRRSTKKEETKVAGTETAGIWHPTFRPEDFLEGDETNRTSPAVRAEPGPSTTTQAVEEIKRKDEDLDLNLSL